MAVLTIDADLAPTGGTFRRLPSEVSANPYSGSLLSYAVDGYVRELVAGEPFAGIARSAIETADAATADGSRYIEAVSGEFIITATLSGVAQDDAAHGREVYASDDGTLTFTPSGNTRIGRVIGVDGTKAVILAATARMAAAASNGNRSLAATGNITLTTADLGRVIVLPSTGAQTITLPASADCAGRTITFKKTTADAVAATITPASGTIDGAANNASIDAAQDGLTIYCDGTNWLIIARQIA
jgi:hypothetical protein